MDISRNPTEHHILLIDDGTNRVIVLDSERYSIGRSSSNAIVLDRDPISREHASLLRVAIPNEDRSIYRLIDGDSTGKLSTNGVFVNEERQTCCDLSNEDTIAFGDVVKALYIHAWMDEIQFSEFMALCASKSSSAEFSENLVAIRQVVSYLSSNDSTSIMLGGRATELRDALVL
ncbi:MAG: FHA domain-containing protein [Acaryochloridaceae cyanobacterium RU_4_10]|jgi:pSer/pThr/pTyr-binding forkhead associated (FHA) protein|nr:FHA domain-containing protein [Acaryochloridaceae cyanobacterium RU_4_10]